MRTDIPKPDPGADAPPNMHEADIGSGERSPGQHETDEMIRDIPKRGSDEGNKPDAGQAGSQQSTSNKT
ncbi:hypothetical protein ACCD08_23600 [Telluria sp. Tellsp104]